jgi:hypothetical protein
MPKIVLEMVALIFQRIERLILDPPPRSTTPHELIHRAFVDPQVRHPAEMLDLVLVPLPALQEVDEQVCIGLIERHITHKPKPVAQPRLGIVPIVIAHPSGSLSRRHVRKQGGMVAFLDPQKVMHLVVLQYFDVRGIGTEAVFGDDQLEVRMILPQLGDQALGGTPFTVILGRAILLDNGLGHQRKHLALVGVNESGAQHLVAIGDGAVLVVHFQT